MISSRCNDSIRTANGGSVTLSEVRKAAKTAIESFQLFGHDTFECWVHEDEPSADGSADFWDQCLSEVRRRDVLLVLYNGNAGFGGGAENVGICHAELMAAMEIGGAKVRFIDLTRASAGRVTGDKARNKRFEEYVERLSVMRRFAENSEEALRLLQDALQDAVVNMVNLAGFESRKGRYDIGAPLDWSRLDYTLRKREMEKVLKSSLQEQAGIDGTAVYFACHAVPAAMAVAAAREMVGRPFLRDHESIDQLQGDTAGPVHVIACHKGVTENQAVAMLGFPDATIITPPFGVYVADNIQKIQLVFLANCRDESSTRYAAQRFLDWLARSGEARYLTGRARGRKAIVSAIAAEQKGGRGNR
jgi:hypothetical protein